MTSSSATPDEPPWNERPYPHPPPRQRTSYEIDKDRVIHCETFRSLQRKTQVQAVAAPPDADIADGEIPVPFRTRLNHVIEVAQISRSVARAVGADEYLAEAIALAHDLGHPPFGHAGERALQRMLAKSHPEWNANVHSLAVVDAVEQSHVRQPGLNLTWATREGIARHSTPFDEPVSFGEFARTPNGGIECQIVDIADMIAYLSHDLDDALTARFVTLEEVSRTDPAIGDLVATSTDKWEEYGQGVWPPGDRATLIRKALVSRLVGQLVQATIEETIRRLDEFAMASPVEVRLNDTRVVAAPEPTAQTMLSLLEFLFARYYRSERVSDYDRRGEELIYLLFGFLVDRPDYVPHRFKSEDWLLSVAHYLISLDDLGAERLAEHAARELG